MKQFLVLSFLVFLFGCASSYELSKETLDYRSSLNDQKALDIVKQNIVKSADQEGLCSAKTHSVQDVETRLPAVEGTNLLFTSKYGVSKGMSTSRVGVGQMKITTLVEMHDGRYKVDLKNLNKIRIMDDSTGWGCGPVPGHIVLIDEPGVADIMVPKEGQLIKPTVVEINVAPKNLDRFVAALSYLSPNAKIIHGTGL